LPKNNDHESDSRGKMLDKLAQGSTIKGIAPRKRLASPSEAAWKR
jgi:hypothetical protein